MRPKIRQGKIKREYRPHYDEQGNLVRRYRPAGHALVSEVTYPPKEKAPIDYRPSKDYRASDPPWTDSRLLSVQSLAALDAKGAVREARLLRKLLAKRAKPEARIGESLTLADIKRAKDKEEARTSMCEYLAERYHARARAKDRTHEYMRRYSRTLSLAHNRIIAE